MTRLLRPPRPTSAATRRAPTPQRVKLTPTLQALGAQAALYLTVLSASTLGLVALWRRAALAVARSHPTSWLIALLLMPVHAAVMHFSLHAPTAHIVVAEVIVTTMILIVLNARLEEPIVVRASREDRNTQEKTAA